MDRAAGGTTRSDRVGRPLGRARRARRRRNALNSRWMTTDRSVRTVELRDSSEIQQGMTASHVLRSMRGTSQLRRVCAIAALSLACIYSAHSAEVSIEIHGLSPELEEAARASLELNHYA